MKLTSCHFMIAIALGAFGILGLGLAYKGAVDAKKAVLEYQHEVDVARMAADGRVRLKLSKPEDILKEIGE